MCFVDFKKAFDSVQHRLLWEKLHSLGISRQMIAILKSMYAKATARVKIAAQQVTANNKGVRQGCKLSPLLFSLFLSGLKAKLAESEVGVSLQNTMLDTLMFADNIVLLSSSADGLRKHLETLETFCLQWHLEINPEKTKICIFGANTNQTFLYKGTILEIVHTYKYLGIWINRNRKFHKARKHLCLQAKKVVFSLKQRLAQLHHPPVLIPLKLFDAIVKPVLCYGCEFWGFEMDQEVEKIEQHYLKYILQLSSTATKAAVRGELGQLPVHLFWKERILKYWFRLNKDDIPILLHEALLIQQYMVHSGKICWLLKVHQLYSNAGLTYKCDMVGIENVKDHVNEIMSQYRDQYIQEWYTRINRTDSRKENAGNKMRTYKLFKQVFQIEPYLLCVKFD